MNWQEQLNQKEKELNIKKEENNGHSISSASIGNRHISRGVSSIRISSSNKEINNKGGKVMITKEAAFEDLEKISVDAPVGKVIIEVARILIKILATIRSNQLLTDSEKVKIREARKARDIKKEQK